MSTGGAVDAIESADVNIVAVTRVDKGKERATYYEGALTHVIIRIRSSPCEVQKKHWVRAPAAQCNKKSVLKTQRRPHPHRPPPQLSLGRWRTWICRLIMGANAVVQRD
jgi:hypothetical protein